MHIALCDDTPSILESLTIYLSNYCEDNYIKPTIHSFDCGEDLLISKEQFDIVFMDIYLKGMKGTDTVRSFRKNQKSQIIFITTSSDHAIEAFGLNATHYLVKPLTQNAVSDAMDRCLTSLDLQIKLNKFLELKSDKGMITILTSNIIYIEVFNKTSIIHTKTDHIEVHSSLDALLKMLDKPFFMRAQRSYIVNMNFIEDIANDRIYLKGDIEIVLSRKNRENLKKQYQQFLYSLARGAI